MKRKDCITIISILLLIAMCFVIGSFRNSEPGQYIKITHDSKLIGTYSLFENREIRIDNNIITVKDGNVYMSQADCPDKLCTKQKAISSVNEQIICLPNRIVVSIATADEPVSKSGFYFNTYINVTMYDSNKEEILDNVMDLCSKYENICSRTSSTSELYKLNHRLISPINNSEYPISEELYDMISIGLAYSKLSNQRFNIAIAPVSEQWDFSSGSNTIPDEASIKEALLYTDCNNITLNDNGTISFKNDKTMIDLGGMAKGYIADRIKEYLLSMNVNSATISLGGNILCIGNKNGEPFKIGIQKPFDSTGSSICSVEVADKSVVTSGIYERYFEKDGILYHHLLDSSTGFPINNDINGITIISDKSVDGDCLSTWLFSLGSDAALNYAKEHPEIDIIIVDKNNNIIK